MTKVSFLYGTSDRWQAALAWLTDAWRARRPVTVFHPDVTERARFDRFLWSNPATGFLPHCVADSPLAVETTIILTGDATTAAQDHALLNLSDEVPTGFTRYEHLIEIISTDEPVKCAGRERFRLYRERGYAIESTDLGGLG